MNREIKKTFRPRFEVLEDRTVPAVSVTKFGSTLQIKGDINAATGGTLFFGSSDSVTINVLASGKVTAAGSTFTGIKKITVKMGKLNDKVTFKLANSVKVPSLDVNVDLGTGLNDTFTGTLGGKTNVGQLIGLTVTKGFVLFGDTTASVDATNFDIVAGSTLNVALTGSAGKDSLKLKYDGKLNGTLLFAIDGFGGDDNIAQAGDTAALLADLNLQAGSNGTIGPASVKGGAGTDTLQLTYTKSAADTVALSASTDGGAGADTIRIKLGVSNTADAADTVFVLV